MKQIDLNMVDVGEKSATKRSSSARCELQMSRETIQLLEKSTLPKGNALLTAKVAGIMAAKRTHELIPLCHPLDIDKVDITIEIDHNNCLVLITSTVSCTGKTGVEMEALVAASISALTIYDMCKSVEAGIVIKSLRLMKKSGGKSGTVVFQ